MTRTAITDVGTVTVTVADQDKAAVFYTDTLGFETRMDAPMPNGGRWITVAPPAGRVAISLIPASSESPAGTDTLPIKADLRDVVGKDVGDTVDVHLMERIEP